MKTAVTPQVRVKPELRADLDSVLLPGETLTEFVEASVRRAVEYRRVHFDPGRRGPVETSKEGRGPGEAVEQMTFRVEFTPEALADLDRAETAEEASRAFEAVEAMRTPELVLVIGARRQREEDFL